MSNSAIEPRKLPIVIDIDNRCISHTEYVLTQQDTNSILFEITIQKNGIDYDLGSEKRVILTFKKEDGTRVKGDAKIINANKGIVNYTVGTPETAFVGEVISTVEIYDKFGGRLTTPEFSFWVVEQLDDGEAIKSRTEYPILTTLIGSALAETDRQKAENIRKNQETQRINNENTRNANEEKRKSQEQSRVNEEKNVRVKNEQSREQQEKIRQNQESTRQNQEKTRLSSEKVRVDAEIGRQASENTRVKNESTRQNQEKTRLSSESARNNQEELRKKQESSRLEAEKLRVSQEQARANKEKNRVDNENIRVTQEQLRVNEEKIRVSNEKTRVSSESERKKQFDNLSDKMNNLISGHSPTGVRARDIRNITPNRLTQSLIEPFFISKNQIEGKNESGDWHDLLALNTYCDSSGGKTNALAFDKKTHKIHHYQANFGSDKWGDSKEIAYVEDINSKLQGGKYTEYTGENITCNNTLDGATKDMVVEGVTYQNICIDSNIERTLNSKHRIQEHNLVSLIPANTDFRININITGKKAPKFGLLVYFVDANAGKPCYDILTKEVYHQNICFRKNYPISKIAIYLEQKEIEGDSTAYITYKDFSVVLDKNYNQYVEGIKSVGEDEENEINILSTGKNLFDLSQIKYSKSDTNSIIPIKNGLRLENIWATSVCFKHNLKPSTKYTTSLIYKEINPPIGSTDNSGGKMLLYSSRFKNKPLIYLFGDKGSKHTFTTPKDIEDYDMIYLYSAGGGGSYNGIVEITNIQVEESSSQTPYESCKSDDTDILLPSPLRCLSKEVKDTIELINNKWFHVQRIGKTVLNGDEYWCYEQNKYKDKMGFYSWLKISKGNNIIADKLKVSSYGDIVGDNNKNKICTLDGDYNVIRVGMQKSSLSPQNEEGLKKWLKENPVTIYYELKTPILTPLDTICNLKTYDGITHIFSKNVIPPTLKFKVANGIGTAMRDEFNYLEKIDNVNIAKTKNEIDNKIIISNTQPDSKLNEIWIEIEGE